MHALICVGPLDTLTMCPTLTAAARINEMCRPSANNRVRMRAPRPVQTLSRRRV